MRARGFCCSLSVLALARPGGAVPHCLPGSGTATPSPPAPAAGASLGTPTQSVTQKPRESRTPAVPGLYGSTSWPGQAGPQPQPGPQHQLNWDYPAAEAAASHLTLAALSAGQQPGASHSPWAVWYAGFLPIPTVSEWKGAWHLGVLRSRICSVPSQRVGCGYRGSALR